MANMMVQNSSPYFTPFVSYIIDNIAYETGLETDDVTSLTCIQIWVDKVCYAGDKVPAKEGHLNGQVMLFCVVV